MFRRPKFPNPCSESYIILCILFRPIIYLLIHISGGTFFKLQSSMSKPKALSCFARSSVCLRVLPFIISRRSLVGNLDGVCKSRRQRISVQSVEFFGENQQRKVVLFLSGLIFMIGPDIY